MDIKYWEGGLERHEIDAIKKIENVLSTSNVRNKIDPKITNRIWKNMIYSYIDYERRNFKKK